MQCSLLFAIWGCRNRTRCFQAGIKFTCEDEGAIHHAARCIQGGVKDVGMWDLEIAKASWSAKIDPNREVAYVGERMTVGVN